MTQEQLSAYLTDVPVHTLTQWRYLGTGPRWFKLGRHVRYRLDDVQEWLEQQRRGG